MRWLSLVILLWTGVAGADSRRVFWYDYPFPDAPLIQSAEFDGSDVRNVFLLDDAARVGATIRAMLPIWFGQPCTQAHSGSVFVSADEFSNSLSTNSAISAARSGSFTRMEYHPTCPFLPARASSK